MCYHYKYLFNCGCVTNWGKRTDRKCRFQETFEEGQHQEECSQKWSHPRTTYFLPEACAEHAVQRNVEEEERKQRIEEWKKKDEETKRRFAEGGKKREATLNSIREKLDAATKGLEKTKKSGEGKAGKFLKRDRTSKDEDSNDEASVKRDESWDDVEVET